MAHRLALLLAWLGTIAIVILSLVPVQLRPHVLEVKQYEHFGAYFATAAVFTLVYAEASARLSVGISLSILAGLLEVAQRWVPGRDSSVIDWAASSIGDVAGILIVVLLFWIDRMVRRRRGQLVR